MDTGAETTIMSEDLYRRVESFIKELLPQQKPVLGVDNMPLQLLGEAEATLQSMVLLHSKVYLCVETWPG